MSHSQDIHTDPRYLKALGRDQAHAPSETVGFTQGLDIPVILLTGIISGILVLSILVATHGWYLKVASEQYLIKEGNPSGAALTWDNQSTQSIRNSQKEALSKYTVVNKDAGIVTIPIDEAMKAFVESGGTVKAVLPPAAK